MSEQINGDRRQFLRVAAAGVAAAPFIPGRPAYAQSGARPASAPNKTTFAALKQINAGVLNVG